MFFLYDKQFNEGVEENNEGRLKIRVTRIECYNAFRFFKSVYKMNY